MSKPIDDRTAQRIAADWHGGSGSPLYSFASTGAINRQALRQEVRPLLQSRVVENDRDEAVDLMLLLDYFDRRGDRPMRSIPEWRRVIN